MIPVFEPQVRFSYAAAVAKQLLTGWIGPGKQTEKFEEMLADLPGSGFFATATTSGTTALLLALKALDLDPGAKVLFPAYTMLAGANAARFLGYQVQLVDVSETTGCMNIQQAAELCNAGDVRAVIFVDHNGYCGAQLRTLARHCRQLGIPLIEDASQALGVVGAGSHGDIGTFSFSPQKLCTTGQGGALITREKLYHLRIRQWQDHGGNWRKTRIHENIGANFKFNDLLAAYGNAQLKQLPKLVVARDAIWQAYRRELSIWEPSMASHSGWCVIYRTPRANSLVAYLAEHKVQAACYYRAVHENPPYLAPLDTYPTAVQLSRELVYLPSSLTLTTRQIKYICRRVQEWEALPA